MSEKLELRVVFAAVDKFLRPVKAITAGASEASKALKANKDRLHELNRTLSQVDAFKKAERDAAIAANAFQGAQARIAAMRAEMDRAGPPTKAMVKELERAGKEAERLRERHQSLMGVQQQYFQKLKAGGVDVSRLTEEHRRLAGSQAEAANATTRLSAALEAENQKMKKLHAARAQLAKSQAMAGRMAVTGAGITAAGAAVGLPVAKAGKDFADFETAMLGVARQVEGARDENGKLTASYYEIGAAVKAMSERIPMAANDIAKIVADGARMGIKGKDAEETKKNLLIYAETTALMASAFDLPVDQVGQDIGKISQLYKVPIKDIKQLGDAINWLDDNAQSNAKDIIDVMQRIAGVATTVGMSYKEAAALGSTFLSLGASAEVAATASNAMIRELSVATMQSKRFREGAKMLNLDLKELQKSASTDATGTILRIMEALNKLPKEQQLEAATRLFGKEFGDDAAKLANNLEEYRRQLRLVNDEKARGSMQKEGDARGDTVNARLTMARNALTNLSSDLGEHLKPALVETMEGTLSVLQAVRAWSKENPGLSAGIMTTVKWLAIGLTVLGALAIGASAILVPLAAMKFGLTAIGLSAGPLAASIWAVVSPVAKLAAAFGAGYAAGTLLNEGLNRGLSAILGYETSLGEATYDLVQKVKGNFGELLGWFQALPTRLQEAGINMMDGFILGIRARWDALRETVTGVAGGAVDWVKEKLGIRSPSRVFAELGQFTMQGLEQGIRGNEDGPLGAVASMAKQLAGLGAGVAIGGAAMAGQIPLDTRPPVSPAGMLGGMVSGGDTYHITIQAAPGMNEAQLAGQVERILERIQAKKAARARSRLSDSE